MIYDALNHSPDVERNEGKTMVVEIYFGTSDLMANVLGYVRVAEK